MADGNMQRKLSLSCGKCKAISSFSGMPLTCEVCGWVCSTTNMRAIVTPKTNYELNRGISGGGSFFPRRTAKPTIAGSGLGDSAAWLGGLLVLAFYAGCLLIVIALMVWAWHYLFG